MSKNKIPSWAMLFFIGLPLVFLIGVFYLLKLGYEKLLESLDLSNTSIDNIEIPIWLLVVLTVIILIGIILYNKGNIFSKTGKITKSWKIKLNSLGKTTKSWKINWNWLWCLLGIALIYFLATWLYAQYSLKKAIQDSNQSLTTITVPDQRFDMNGMSVISGKTYLLDGNEPLKSFVCQDGSELQYYIVMVGHETRNWTRETKLSSGNVIDKAVSELQPYPWAKEGPAKITFSKSCIVVVR